MGVGFASPDYPRVGDLPAPAHVERTQPPASLCARGMKCIVSRLLTGRAPTVRGIQVCVVVVVRQLQTRAELFVRPEHPLPTNAHLLAPEPVGSWHTCEDERENLVVERIRVRCLGRCLPPRHRLREVERARGSMRSSVIPRRDFSVGAFGRLKNLHCSTTKLTTTTLAATQRRRRIARPSQWRRRR